jgi:EAL domain-containing protein (putative c-di-GMP-specific phosphodiesterase class I)
MGVGIALDDFGTGYSALGYLKSFPITQLKIDRMFVREIATDLQDAAITSAIIALARGLDKTVVAEGVETLPSSSTLEKQGCTRMQGYLFCRPVPGEEFRKLLAERGAHGWMLAARR